MGDLDGTMLHYLAVRKAMVSVHRPVHSKITLTTRRLPGKLTAVHPENGSQGAIKRQGGPFLCFEVFSALIVQKLPKRAPTKTQLATHTVDY